MASSSKLPPPKKEPLAAPSLLPQPPKSSANPPHASITGTAQAENPSSTPVTANFLSPSPEESALAKSSHLTRQELLRRRLHHVRKLSGVYKDYFWALMEECRVQYRLYYWKYGVSPFKGDEERAIAWDREMVGAANVEGSGETGCGGKLGLGLGFADGGVGGPESKLGGNNLCTFLCCTTKAMALTSFCHLHILSDPHQKLYKSCNYVIKSLEGLSLMPPHQSTLRRHRFVNIAQAGPIVCGKPILRSTVPSLCSIHFQKAQKHVTRALRKAGLNSSSTKLAPKFHVIVAEYVRQIQAKRRESQKPSSGIAVVKEEHIF